MNFWNNWVVLLPLLSLLGACAGVDNQAKVADSEIVQPEETAAADRSRLLSEWADFIGIDPEEAADELDRIGLTPKLGGNAPLNEADLSAYLNLVFAKDATWAGDIHSLNAANIRMFGALRGLLVSPDVDARQDAQEQYLALTDRAKALRLRAQQGAQILGFLLAPTDSGELLEDEAFAPAGDAFAQPLMLPLFGIPFSDPPTERQQAAVELLAAVTFRAEGKFLSFYSFTAPSPEEELPAQPTIPVVRTLRGAFQILEAKDNPYFSNLNTPGTPVGNPGDAEDRWGRPGDTSGPHHPDHHHWRPYP
jgi:hypothetical protein